MKVFDDIVGEQFVEDELLHNPSGDFVAIDLKDPTELLALIEPELFDEGKLSLHKWQMEAHRDIAGDKAYTWRDPLKMAFVACNGSGKDRYVIAPTALWLTLAKVRHLCVVTSSSGNQMTGQTENYMRSYGVKINKALKPLLGFEPLIIRRRYIYCRATGSEIRMFVTDEPGKAEGYHPLEPTAEMAIIVNEAKSVDEDIFQALTRCTGYNRWIEISSPGATKGHLYDVFRLGDSYPARPTPGHWWNRRITAFDCPHLGTSYIKDVGLLYGEGSELYRSMILAEFTSSGILVVIPYDVLRACLDRNVKAVKFGPKRAGVDVAASYGGDENVVAICQGNALLELIPFYEKDTTKTTTYLVSIFQRHGLDARNINVDDGGIGRGVIDQLHQKGWPVNRILNQSKSLIGHEYGNRGAELWFSFARLIQESVISGLKDPLLIEQLSTRYYKRSEALGKLVLEGKKEAKAEGRKSPDRADALVLAFAGTDIREFLHTCGSDLWTSQVKSPADKAKNKYQSMEELIEFMHSVKFGLTPAKRVKENFGTVDTNRGRTYVDLYYDGINSN